ncbi:tryptophan--tRNA ligase [Senegalia massiliensis]|uniref:Tryptophan--tRNA ligase n=1 Tax=Senegalia massiliensis TaxID=1720316 RepID=A0A845QXE6_9CLOT|nr:tryptophan--tRNA ligase [Senegalia massiliensis]NBI05822.1 tryptophan--tRNA ligase [Senegalia massiliensis]
MSEKKVIFSGVQPSGELTLGNYLGAIRNWVDLQEKYDCYYCVVDLHSITVPQIAKDLRRRTLEVMSLYMACGIDPSKSTIFIQSHVPEHTQLSWVLSSMTYLGELNRMTQFKDKIKKNEKNLNAGLLTYPVLMASDILLYSTDSVPVGEDQKQHLELARDLASRFNNRYSETFKVPDPLISTVGARIMDLQNPSQKMSKSAENENGYILLKDDPDTIRRKVKRSITDSINQVRYSDEQLGIKNLLTIYSKLTGEKISDIENKYIGKGYGEFKEDISEIIIDTLKPIREKYLEYMNDKAYLEKVYKEGSEKASRVARKTLRKVYKKTGFIPR